MGRPQRMESVISATRRCVDAVNSEISRLRCGLPYGRSGELDALLLY
jgi:hypothetical protein